MTHSSPSQLTRCTAAFNGHWRDGSTQEAVIVEAWGQGFFIGALIVMTCITVAASRKGVLLHKLILIEQLLAIPHGTFCFMAFTGYGWYVSSTATLLFCSYLLHNIVAWLKVKPFFVGNNPSFFNYRTGQIYQWVYHVSLGLTVPVWAFNAYNNFEWNNNVSDLYRRVRPYEVLIRDPWWVSTNTVLLHVIGKSYGISTLRLVRISPRLGILLLAVFLAIAFTVIDVVATILDCEFGSVDGINPYWKLSLVFKCLTDAIMLDDFATELKRIGGDQRLRSQIQQSSLSGLTKRTNEDYVGRENNNHALCIVEATSPISTGHKYSEAERKNHALAGGSTCLEIEDVGRLV